MKTKVIFRKFPDGDVIALFPELCGTYKYYQDCLSYMHVGQHGAASLDIVQSTKLATPVEYQMLYYELIQNFDYDLRIAKKFTYKDLLTRKEQIEK
jgi:hypothetical protein